jgi:dienelactone hydrolase
VEAKDHVREHIAYDSVPGTTVTAYVLVPKGLKKGERRPGVLALHGHHQQGKETVAGLRPNTDRSQPADDYGLGALRAGFVTLCPDWWGWGGRVEAGFKFNDDMCNTKFVAAQMYGMSLLSLMISDGEAGLDIVTSRSDVDPNRIAVMGNSTGGRMTMWLAAFDRRVKAAVCSGCLNCFRERSLKLSSCGLQFLPGLLRHGDVGEVFSVIAPRPLMIMSGRKDPLLFEEDRARMGASIKQAYAAFGAEKNLELFEHEGGHYLPQGPAMKWLQKILQ